MGKSVDASVLNAALNQIKNNATALHILSAAPAAWSDIASYTLGNVAVSGSDFTLANGDTSGRKVTVGSKTVSSCSASGTATHVAIVDSVNSIVLAVTTCTSQAVASGGSATIAAFKYEIQAPT